MADERRLRIVQKLSPGILRISNPQLSLRGKMQADAEHISGAPALDGQMPFQTLLPDPVNELHIPVHLIAESGETLILFRNFNNRLKSLNESFKIPVN